jgi:hypothetical protein
MAPNVRGHLADETKHAKARPMGQVFYYSTIMKDLILILGEIPE